MALKIKPDYNRANGGIGTTYNNEGIEAANKGDIDEAINLLRKALQYDPDSHQIKKNLDGVLYAK